MQTEAFPPRSQRGLRPAICLLALLPVVGGALIGGDASAAYVEAPDPPEGRWAATTLALLHHQKDLCDSIAGQVIGHWQGFGAGTAQQGSADGDAASLEGQEKAIRDYVLDTQLSDLAASRATADIIDRFLPRSRSETSGETSSALERLFGLEKSLCDTVALPTAPIEDFRSRIADILDRIERENEELGRLLVVPDEDLEAALEPYLMPIQLAGISAEGEYLEYLESIRPKPKGPSTAERMAAWHRQVYGPAVAPSKTAFGGYLKARRANDGRALGRHCRDLSRATIALLRRPEVFEAPDEKVRAPLQQAYVEMRGLATHCTAGRYREVQEHFEDLQRNLSTAAERLSLYNLRP
ncbi:MAG: hypothetical protein AAGD06_09350 [Acidobacteriota bacterium]